MVVSVSGLLFSIVLGVIGAIIVLVLTAVMGYLVKIIRRVFTCIVDNFKKWKNNP